VYGFTIGPVSTRKLAKLIQVPITNIAPCFGSDEF
jgi:hypothetical protein